MRFLSIFLIYIFMIQTVSANEGTIQGLKILYDDLQYSATVEWDQKDIEFKKEIENRFKIGLEKLTKQGLTNQEIIAFAASQFKNEKNKSDFTHLIQSLQVSTLGQEEVSRMVNTIINNECQAGANWIGDLPLAGKIAYFIAVTAISSAIVYGMIYGSFAGISDGSNGQVCTEVYVCDTYYDEMGSYESCGYQCAF